MSAEEKTKWAQVAGKLMGQLTAIWFAVTITVLIFAVPTKLIFSLMKWFWNLW